MLSEVRFQARQNLIVVKVHSFQFLLNADDNFMFGIPDISLFIRIDKLSLDLFFKTVFKLFQIIFCRLLLKSVHSQSNRLTGITSVKSSHLNKHFGIHRGLNDFVEFLFNKFDSSTGCWVTHYDVFLVGTFILSPGTTFHMLYLVNKYISW